LLLVGIHMYCWNTPICSLNQYVDLLQNICGNL
jgi:hypothetical protein